MYKKNLQSSSAVCPTCGTHFRKEDRAAPGANDAQIEQIKYCSEKCARKAENRRYYKAHSKKIKATTLRNRAKKA